MPSPRRGLASLADASLSQLGIWPAADHDIGLGAPPGGGARAVARDRPLQLASATHAAARAGNGRRTAALDHSAHTSAAARDTARRERAGTLPTRSPMPPISGHGAPSMVKVTASDANSEPLKAWSWRSGLSLFRRDGRSIPGWRSGPRSSPVKGERRRARPRGLHRSAAGFEDHRQPARPPVPPPDLALRWRPLDAPPVPVFCLPPLPRLGNKVRPIGVAASTRKRHRDQKQ